MILNVPNVLSSPDVDPPVTCGRDDCVTCHCHNAVVSCWNINTVPLTRPIVYPEKQKCGDKIYAKILSIVLSVNKGLD